MTVNACLEMNGNAMDPKTVKTAVMSFTARHTVNSPKEASYASQKTSACHSLKFVTVKLIAQTKAMKEVLVTKLKPASH